MVLGTRTCQNCKIGFTVEPADFKFYEKMQVPPPTWCPECRLIRRMIWRNERSLYLRKCDLCREEKIMMFTERSPYRVYCRECWYSDKWESLDYGREYDFSKTFFEQFDELLRLVPRPGNLQQGVNVGSEYTNRASNNKDCYLLFSSNFNESCIYGQQMNDSRDSLDGYGVQKSELCYECIDCVGSYHLKYSQECSSSSESQFLMNCRNCDHCFGCVNLRNKRYYIFNKPYSKDQYEKILSQWELGKYSTIQKLKKEVPKGLDKHIFPSIIEHKGVNVSGNWIENCKNTLRSFNCRDVENGKYLFSVIGAKDVMDYTFFGRGCELSYDSVSIGYQCSRSIFMNESWDHVADAAYSMDCINASNLFGCVCVRNKKYCILNKQYSKESFLRMREKIITHMNDMPYRDKKARVYAYGEFFPAEVCPFSYNESITQEYFPLSPEEAIKKGYQWKDSEVHQRAITLTHSQLPDHIKDVPDSITNEIISCQHANFGSETSKGCNEQCTQAFRIIPQELKFYRQMNIPLPRLCPNCRHYERLKRRNPLKLWERSCACAGGNSENGAYKNTTEHVHKNSHCLNAFETSYAPQRPEIVYCEKCYLMEVA
ncbi:MAG: hypothetical protein HY001_03245 [Candidatus Portnoybacteria bacterium]|nr:hypothetical protein [Candidatus Portnoybacteria bacterium]